MSRLHFGIVLAALLAIYALLFFSNRFPAQLERAAPFPTEADSSAVEANHAEMIENPYDAGK